MRGGRDGADGALGTASGQTALGRAVQDHAAALEDGARMTRNGLAMLDYQKAAVARTAAALDVIRPDATTDLGEAFARDPALIGEAARGRTAAAIRAMQLEAEVRTNPELRADRFV